MAENDGREASPLPELRRDPVTGEWSILAAGRSRRPGAVSAGGGEPCPFCPGNESLTPPETWAWGREGGEPDTPGWKVRAVPNLYPALMPEAGGRAWGRGGRRGRPARGDHEVIVNSPHHDLSLGDMDAEAAAALMGAWLQRHRHFASRPEVRQVQIIVNHKREAGASLDHPHTQVFALPLITAAMRAELRESRLGGGCALCREAEEAREDGRLVLDNGSWSALVPYAARAPFELRFAPHRHHPDFAAAGEAELEGMAGILTRCLKALSALLGNPAYNLWVHTSPCDGRDHAHYHWHVEMVPRIIVSAGFELATGMHINVLAPREAACRLREKL